MNPSGMMSFDRSSIAVAIDTTACCSASSTPTSESRNNSSSWLANHARTVSQSASHCIRRRWRNLTQIRTRIGTETGTEMWTQIRTQIWAKILSLVGRNLVTISAVLVSGIITWESSTDELRARMCNTIVFPLYLPHAVATSVAVLGSRSVLPGNFLGLYLVRLFMTLRGERLTSLWGLVLFLVSLLATFQSHVSAFYLHKCLCKGRSDKKYPTIDTVADAGYFIVIVTITTLIFSTLIALCVTITPLAKWRCFWQFWSTWWLGVLAAMTTVTPLIVHVMAWKCSWNLFKRPAKVVEVAVTAAIALGLLSVVFFLDLQVFRPMPYLCFPLIMYTALRFNRVGWAVTVTVLAFFGAFGSIRRRGAVYNTVGRSQPWNTELILQIELFNIVMGVVSITLAAAVREKKSLTRRFHQMNRDLECTVECRTRQLLKTNEELQISQQEAEMASRAKSDFLANMSHEIRTPIHGIQGLTALLLESGLTVDQKESLVSVKECADLLLHVINSVLDLAKIEAGRLEVETVPFSVRKLVSSTFRMMQARAQERGLELCWEVDSAVPLLLAGDVGKLQQCLINLVGNALKFTHEGSVSVHVRVASDSLIASRMNALHDPNVLSSRTMATDYESIEAYTRESMFIHFEVRDTGIGINEGKLKDMFKPFTQADASTSRLYGGTGLGLCIVHRFVELLDGTIWVESEVGKGSALHFCLPLLLTKAASAESSPRVPSPSCPPAGKVYKSKPWSLLNGLVFKGPELYNYTGQLQKQPGADSSVISIDDLSAHVARKKESYLLSLSYGRGRPSSTQNLNNQLNIKEPGPISGTRGRRSSGSDYEAYKELRRENFYYGNSRRPHGWNSSRDGDGGASNDVTPTLEFKSLKAGVQSRKDSSVSLTPLKATSSVEGPSLSKLQLKILLVEDNPINQKVASRQLQKHGHVVTIVGDGQQALDIVCAQHDEFDLVLMDVQMPIMDGLAATEQIRMAETKNRWSRVPIMGLTAHAIQGYQDTCLMHGMDGYLGKPFDIQQLLKAIGHMLPQE